ncbi:MAG: 3-deoxy-manno-octulosonate cytidylyltransferase [Bacteroidales bacterium]|jgi:3-deoxy-manno-octulosonate cytidylyltransferase (CMP-KDO synthetase)|nr:3-deoxy-manno-octulosonate cytidylyltransferase [Bacteroidales bacterium]
MKTLAIIPSRYGSTRFEGKPLAKLCGKEMIIWVCEAVKNTNLFTKIIVATDDLRIYNTVISKGFEAQMTYKYHKNGTERCEQVLQNEELNGNFYDVVVNVQGDEPIIKKEQLDIVLKNFEQKHEIQISTLMKQIENIETLMSIDVVKVVASQDNALYFSRCPIPYCRDKSIQEGLDAGIYYKHIGLYAYKPEVLHNIVKLNVSVLEQTESLEQLRWLENGYKININPTNYDSFGIDTMEDLLILEKKLRENNNSIYF